MKTCRRKIRQAVEQRGSLLGVAEHGRPFAEGEVGGDDDGGALVKPADQMEQQLAAGLRERQIAEFVEDDEVEAGLRQVLAVAGADDLAPRIPTQDPGRKCDRGADRFEVPWW